MRVRRHPYTLVELLIAMSLAAGIAGAGYVLLNRTFSYRAVVQKRLDLQGEVRLIARKWRAWVAATDTAAWRTDGTRFAAGKRIAEVKNGKLVLAADGKSDTISLPPAVSAEFSFDGALPVPRAAVLHLTWTTKRGDKTEPRSLRIVACAHPEPAGKAKDTKREDAAHE